MIRKVISGISIPFLLIGGFIGWVGGTYLTKKYILPEVVASAAPQNVGWTKAEFDSCNSQLEAFPRVHFNETFDCVNGKLVVTWEEPTAYPELDKAIAAGLIVQSHHECSIDGMSWFPANKDGVCVLEDMVISKQKIRKLVVIWDEPKTENAAPQSGWTKQEAESCNKQTDAFPIHNELTKVYCNKGHLIVTWEEPLSEDSSGVTIDHYTFDGIALDCSSMTGCEVVDKAFKKMFAWAEFTYANDHWHVDAEDFFGRQVGSGGNTFKQAVENIEVFDASLDCHPTPAPGPEFDPHRGVDPKIVIPMPPAPADKCVAYAFNGEMVYVPCAETPR
jgi:hypothetical protein